MIVHNDVRHDSRVLKEANTLTQHGYKIIVLGISLGKVALPEYEEYNGFTIVRITPKLFRGWLPGRFGMLLPLMPMFPTMSLRLRQIKAKVYHANDFTALFQMILSGMWNSPLVYDSHELFFDRPLIGIPRPLEWMIKALRPLEKPMAKRALKVMTVSDSIADQMAKAMQIPRPIVLRNAVELRTLGETEYPYETEGKRSIVHTGNLFPGRRLHELVTALTHLPDDIVLILMGRGPLEKPLFQLANDLGIRDRMSIMPPVAPQNVVPTASQADAAAILTMTEGMNNNFALPNKLFEAIAGELPVITGPNVEISKVVRHYDIGEICDAHDPQSIARAIETVLDPTNRNRFQTNAKKAREELNWEQEEKKLLAVYEEVFDHLATL